jgi:hypothetical protein
MGYESRPWQAREEVLSYFSGRQGAARKKYRQFIFEGISTGRREELTGGAKRQGGQKGDRESRERCDSRILGSSTFVEELLAEEERVSQERVLFKKKRMNVGELINLVGKEFGVTGEEIIGGSQRQAASRARSVFCYLGSRELGLTGRELSRAFGLTPAAIHYAVVRGESSLKDNKETEEGLLKYLKDLTTSP